MDSSLGVVVVHKVKSSQERVNGVTKAEFLRAFKQWDDESSFTITNRSKDMHAFRSNDVDELVFQPYS